MNGVDIFTKAITYIKNNDVDGFEKFTKSLTKEEQASLDLFRGKLKFANEYLNK